MKLMILIILWCFYYSSIIATQQGHDHTMINSRSPCDYSALYNFGDSNSDTGGIYAAFYPTSVPTYFHRPAGRASDGRLIVDFIADNLGIPYLSAYLDSIGTSFQYGANFATGGATVMKPNESWPTISPFSLEIQVEHYTQFKDRSLNLYNQSKDECVRKRLPKPDQDLSKAIFTMDIGQNDIAFGIRTLSYELQKAYVPKVINEFISQVEVLYKRGARTFWIHNTGPIGCLPVAVAKVQNQAPEFLDEIGCVKSLNDIALLFNKVLREEIVKVRAKLSLASIVYVDMYAAKYELISHAKNQGFEDPFTICCGYHGVEYNVYCGNKGIVNGTEVFAGSCVDPSKVISWDGVHYSEAANRWVEARVTNGSLSDPAIEISRACYK